MICFLKRAVTLVTALLFLLNYNSFGQINLVPNSGFELLPPYSTTCLAGNLNFIEPNYPSAIFWIDPNTFNGSTDYFNSCSNTLPFGETFSAPGPNKLGYQEPRSGNGYISLETYGAMINYRSYATCKLIKKLQQGRFCIQFYVSAADTCDTYCNNMEAYFSSVLPNVNQLFSFQINPQFSNPLTNILNSKTDWMEVKGSFIAQGGEEFITLGNFKNDAQSDTGGYNFINPWNPLESSYFIEDILVIELKALHRPDTLVCPQTTFSQTLQAYPDFDSYVWSTGDTTRIIQITQPGQYWVTASNWCGTVTDTMQVNVFDTVGLGQFLGTDRSFCDYQFPQRVRPLPQFENTFFNYQWSNGSDTSFADVLLPGTYYVTAEHLCGFVTDSITLSLNPNPTVNLGNDSSLCNGQQIVLDAGMQTTYTWSNQSSSQSITVNETGLYGVTVTNIFNCIANDEIQLNFTDETGSFLPNDTALFASEFPYLITLSNQYSNYNSQWLIVNGQLLIENEGVYVLSAIDANGCLVSDSITFSLKKFELIVPSIISKNQNFIINNLPFNSSLKVFDALGQIVYQNHNYQNNFMPLIANAMYFVELVYVPSGTLETAVYKGKLMVVD